MNLFFAETFYRIALTNPRDGAHRVAMEFTTGLGPRTVITTDDVLAEFLGYCASYPKLRRAAGLAVLHLQNDPISASFRKAGVLFLDGLTLYNTRPDKGYSLTDCISMLTMRREGLTQALTNDRHFEQEGFQALFRVS